MGIRDQERERLEKYAKGLGTTVTYKPYVKGGGAAAEWIINDDKTTELVFYTWSGQSKTRLILSFVHELAHHMAHIYNNRTEDKATLEALDAEDNRKSGEPPIPKEQRKLIYLSEKEDSVYRHNVWQECDIKIPKWRLELDIALDIWGYKIYYLRGDHPTQDEEEKKRKQLKPRYYKKNE